MTTTATQNAHRSRLERFFRDGVAEPVPVICRLPQDEYLDATDAAFQAWLEASLGALLPRRAEAENPLTFRPWMIEFWPLGVHFVDLLFGATVSCQDGQFWADYLKLPMEQLTAPALEESQPVRWMLACMHSALARMPEDMMLTTPVFSSPLNILVNLYGPAAVEAFGAPDARLAGAIAAVRDTIAGLHRLVRREFPSPRVRHYAASHRFTPDGFGHICGCTTHLLGPQAYAALVAPADEAILRVYPEGGTIHLCGHHTQHIPCWRRMEALRGVQLNDAAADDFADYFKGLRPDQILYVTPTEAMPIERILSISGGRRIVLQALLDRPIPCS